MHLGAGHERDSRACRFRSVYGESHGADLDIGSRRHFGQLLLGRIRNLLGKLLGRLRRHRSWRLTHTVLRLARTRTGNQKRRNDQGEQRPHEAET